MVVWLNRHLDFKFEVLAASEMPGPGDSGRLWRRLFHIRLEDC